VNQPLYPYIGTARDPGPLTSRYGVVPPDRRSWHGRLALGAVILLIGAILIGCDADPIEEVDVGDVTEGGQATILPGDETLSLTGEVQEILTESALTVTDEGSEDPLLVLVTPATIVNGTAVTLGGPAGGIGQILPPEGTLQVMGTIETFDSVALADRFGIVLNEELFASWEGEPVLIAEQVETSIPDGDLPAETGLESE
jgi:hypothetical protein